jgi:hypothetical protein
MTLDPKNPRNLGNSGYPRKLGNPANDFGSPWRITCKHLPKIAHKGLQGGPMGANERRRASQGVSNRSRGSTKQAQKDRNGVPKRPKKALGTPKASSKEADIHENSRSTTPAASMLALATFGTLKVPKRMIEVSLSDDSDEELPGPDVVEPEAKRCPALHHAWVHIQTKLGLPFAGAGLSQTLPT